MPACASGTRRAAAACTTRIPRSSSSSTPSGLPRRRRRATRESARRRKRNRPVVREGGGRLDRLMQHTGHRAGAATETIEIPLDDVFCPCCQDDLTAAIKQLPHVVGVHVDLEHKVAHLTVHAGMTDAATLRREIEDCNFRNPVPLPKAEVSSHESMHHAASKTAAHGGHEAMGHDMSDPRMAASMEADMRRRFWIALVLSLPVVAYSSLGTLLLGGRELPAPVGRNWTLLAFSTPVALWASSVFHVGAWRSIRSGVLNMSVLVSLGILVSYLFSLGLTFTVGGETFYEAAVMLATFLLFGHWMEMKARRGSSDAVRKLLELAPSEANVERDGRIRRMPVSEVRVGDVLVLQPGERVAVDGEVIDGRTSIDESMVTGESIPVEKEKGTVVVAGTVNQTGSIRYRATKIGADTALARIAQLVETAQASKPPAQRIADRAAHYLVILAVGAGVITLLFWLLVAREPLLFALTLAVTAVVIACPDALGLATPTAVVVGTRRLMDERGITLHAIADRVDELLRAGKTLTIVAVDGNLAGVVAVQDTPRDTAKAAIAGLRELDIEIAMLTGDNRQTAEAVARELGIERVLAEVLPEHKAEEIKHLQSEGKFVAMVGDGINDAPALAQADLGIAIGTGTDVAVETGDIVLMRSDPRDVLGAIRLSKATVTKMKQNLFWAAIYNVIAIPVAAGVLYPAFGILLRPEFGAIAMSASSITVVTNALLLRRSERDLAVSGPAPQPRAVSA